MHSEPENMLEVGRVVATHGLRGDLKVRLHSGDPDLLPAVDQVCLTLPSGRELELAVIRRVVHKGQVLLRFRDYESISLAEPLIGSSVFVTESRLPELDEDEYYWGQLQGLRVIDENRGEIGTIKSMYTTAAHDTYVVDGPCGEVLIPAVKQFVLAIDLDRGEVRVALPQGLFPEA
jgi:16S rRNA processing protein RimM